MKNNYHFVPISGSLRKASFNTMELKATQKLVPEDVSIEQLSIVDIPLYNFDLHEKVFPESIEKIGTSIKAADGLIIVTPEYNYSIPGVLKNVIHFLSKHSLKPLYKKAVGIISASPSILGGVRAQFHIHQILVAVNAITVNIPAVVITEINTKFDENENLYDEKTVDFISKFISSLATFSDVRCKVKNG